MNEWAESLLKKIRENEKTVRQLEPRLSQARERLILYTKLYALETGKQIPHEKKSESQLEMKMVEGEKKPFQKRGRLSIAEATQRMLEELKGPLHGKEILERLPAYGASAKSLNSLWATLKNRPKLFKNLGGNRWVLQKTPH